MLKSIDFFINKYKGQLQCIAIALAFASSSFIYFLRDGLGLAPGNAVFTFVLTFGLIISLTFLTNFKSLLKPNLLVYWLSFVFMAMSFAYLLLYAPNRGWFTKTPYHLVQMSLIFIIYLFMLSVKIENISKYLIPSVLWISSIGSLFFLGFVLMNPQAALNNRAAIAFKGVDFGNPHMYARPAFFGLVAAVFSYKTANNSIKKMIVHILLLVNVFIVFLTQTFAAIISMVLFFILYFLLSTTFTGNVRAIGQFFKNKLVIFSIIATSLLAYQAYQSKKDLFELAWSLSVRRMETIFSANNKSLETSNIKNQKKKVTNDDSARNRVDGLEKIRDLAIENSKNNFPKLLFGNGYQHFYADIPVVEVFDSFGIVGLIVFLWLFGYVVYLMGLEMIRPRSHVTQFIAFCCINLVLINFTFGLIADYYRWILFALAGRFLIPWKTLKIQ